MLIRSKTGGFDGLKTYPANEVVDVNRAHARIAVSLGHAELVNADGEPLPPADVQILLNPET